MDTMRFIIITGLSGAGKSLASRYLEDIGYFCVDNLPPALIPTFTELCARPGSDINRVAMVVDIRGRELFGQVAEALNELTTKGVPYEILYMDADDQTLVNRYKETRRRHPLSDGGHDLQTCIQEERDKLTDIRERADQIIDTSNTSPQELREQLAHVFRTEAGQGAMFIRVTSFGFKYGAPRDADLIFDVRFLRNPYYVPELAHIDGRAPQVQQFLSSDPDTREFIARFLALIEFCVPRFLKEGKPYLAIAIGCTGGRHRSVYVAEELAQFLQRQGFRVVVEHRDLQREASREAASLEAVVN